MTTIAPNKITLTCTITGKTTTWTNKKIIQAKIDKHGSLEAFMAQYTAKGAQKKNVVVKAKMIKPILLQGKALGEMTSEEYAKKYPRIERTYANKNGEVVTTVCVEPVIVDSIKYANAT
jgi:antitoxin component YwqK of YwqJK toxin-antitoxin module